MMNVMSNFRASNGVFLFFFCVSEFCTPFPKNALHQSIKKKHFPVEISNRTYIKDGISPRDFRGRLVTLQVRKKYYFYITLYHYTVLFNVNVWWPPCDGASKKNIHVLFSYHIILFYRIIEKLKFNGRLLSDR